MERIDERKEQFIILNADSIRIRTDDVGCIYLCPVCKREGLPSIHGNFCTACANIKRGFSIDQPVFIRMNPQSSAGR
jgi:hypothetical protein